MRINKMNKLRYNKSSPGKSLTDILKLVVIVAFINYQLIYLQQVDGRARGLIYNRNGKFIYRSPKSDQGHIIVIDDRQRDSGKSEAVRDDAESVYQPARVISPRLYHAPSQLAAPIRGYYPGEQFQLINIDNLQEVVQHPALSQSVNAAAVAARPRPAIRQPMGPVSLPVIPVYQPVAEARPAELDYANYAHQPQVAQAYQPTVISQQQAYVAYPGAPQQAAQPPPFSVQYRAAHGHHNNFAPTSANRVYEADTPVEFYDLPVAGLDHHPENMALFDDGSANYPPHARNADNSKQLEFDELINNNNPDPFADHSRILRQITSPPSRTRHGKTADRGHTQLLSINRMKSNNDISSSGLSSSRSSKRNSDKTKQKDASKPTDEMSLASDTNLNELHEDKNNRYWKQFKDQFEIVH